MYPWGRESIIQQTIPSQDIFVAELNATLNDPLFLPMNNIAIFWTVKVQEKYLSALNISKKWILFEYFEYEWMFITALGQKKETNSGKIGLSFFWCIIDSFAYRIGCIMILLAPLMVCMDRPFAEASASWPFFSPWSWPSWHLAHGLWQVDDRDDGGGPGQCQPACSTRGRTADW